MISCSSMKSSVSCDEDRLSRPISNERNSNKTRTPYIYERIKYPTLIDTQNTPTLNEEKQVARLDDSLSSFKHSPPSTRYPSTSRILPEKGEDKQDEARYSTGIKKKSIVTIALDKEIAYKQCRVCDKKINELDFDEHMVSCSPSKRLLNKSLFNQSFRSSSAENKDRRPTISRSLVSRSQVRIFLT